MGRQDANRGAVHSPLGVAQSYIILEYPELSDEFLVDYPISARRKAGGIFSVLPVLGDTVTWIR